MEKSSRPERSPSAISDDIVDAILTLRREEKWGNERIAAHLKERGVIVSASTVQRTLKRHSISRVRDMDPPTGELARVVRYEHDAAGDMVHIDIKKVGRIPRGGGWAVHGRGTPEALASKRKGSGTGKVGVVYLHSTVDDYSRIAYTEVLADEKGETAAEFWKRAVVFYAGHGITHIKRCLSDNGSCYRSRKFAEALKSTHTVHKRTRPYTPKTNGKVERYNQTMNAEWLRRRAYDSEEDRVAALADFLNYYNYERKHSALGWNPPISRAPGTDGALVEPQTNLDELVDTTPEQLRIFDL